jgi:hypothetical protein
MGLSSNRVAEIFIPASRAVGSGYFLTPRLVLTAKHVVVAALPPDGPIAAPEEADESAFVSKLAGVRSLCRVRSLTSPSRTFVDAVAVWWSPNNDVALLALNSLADTPGPFPPVEWFDLIDSEPIDVTAVGFPEADVEGDIRESRQLFGRLNPLSGVKSGRWVIQVAGSIGRLSTISRSSWAGMSGAAVFAGDLLIGMIRVDPDPTDPERLELWALPARFFAEHADFERWVHWDGGHQAWSKSKVSTFSPMALLKELASNGTLINRTECSMLRPQPVFVSYSDDSPEHLERVRGLAGRLMRDGLKVVIDFFQNVPKEGWPSWCERQVQQASKVLVVITSTYNERYYNGEPSSKGLGAAFEALLIRQELDQSQGPSPKYRVVIFDDAEEKFIPGKLRSNKSYCLSDPNDYKELLLWLREEATVVPSPVVWPEPADKFLPRLADRKSEFSHFKRVISGRVPKRILLLKGSSGYGKTALLRGLIAYCKEVKVAYGVVDTEGRSLEQVLQTIHSDLGALTRNFHAAREQRPAGDFLADLDRMGTPVVIAIDNYHKAIDSVRSWVDYQLLPVVTKLPAVVLILCGAELPDPNRYLWAEMAAPFELLAIPMPEEWFEFACREIPGTQIQISDAKTLTGALHGHPANTSALILRYAEDLRPKAD